jgi:hypothetical protein
MIVENVDRLDYIDVFQRDPDAKFGHDLSLIILGVLSGPFRSELLDGIGRPTRLAARLDESDGASRPAAQYAAPLAVLFTHVSLSSLERARLGEMTGSDGCDRTTGSCRGCDRRADHGRCASGWDGRLQGRVVSALFLFTFRLGRRSFPLLFQLGLVFSLLGLSLMTFLLLLEPGLFLLVGRAAAKERSERGRTLVVIPVMVLEEPDEVVRVSRVILARLGQVAGSRMILDRVRVAVVLLLLLLLLLLLVALLVNGTRRTGRQADGRLGRTRDDRSKSSKAVHRSRRLRDGRSVARCIRRSRHGTSPISTTGTSEGEEIASTQLRSGRLNPTQPASRGSHAVPSDGEDCRVNRWGLTPALASIPVEETPTPTARGPIPVMPDVMVQEPFQVVQRSSMVLCMPGRMCRSWRGMSWCRGGRVRGVWVPLIHRHGRSRGRFSRGRTHPPG